MVPSYGPLDGDPIITPEIPSQTQGAYTSQPVKEGRDHTERTLGGIEMIRLNFYAVLRVLCGLGPIEVPELGFGV